MPDPLCGDGCYMFDRDPERARCRWACRLETPTFRSHYMITLPEHVTEAAARAAHEANRAYCIALGDTSQVSWDDAPEWQRTSARNGVAGVVAGNTPRQSHEGWMAEKQATGWVYGPVKDADKKEHPCMVLYDALPVEQRRKDDIFIAVVRSVVDALT